jgi:hypothetical protein
MQGIYVQLCHVSAADSSPVEDAVDIPRNVSVLVGVIVVVILARFSCREAYNTDLIPRCKPRHCRRPRCPLVFSPDLARHRFVCGSQRIDYSRFAAASLFFPFRLIIHISTLVSLTLHDRVLPAFWGSLRNSLKVDKGKSL